MIKKYGKYVTLCLLVAAVAVSGVSAYFTANDTATNNFTVNKVDVDLTEPDWDDVVKGDDGELGTADDVVITATPNMTIAKDPTVTNLGNVDQFVFVKVTVPFQNIITAQLDGTKNAAADIELFTWNADAAGTLNVIAGDDETAALGDINDGWTLIKREIVGSTVEYTYAYGSETAMTALAAGATTAKPLFDSVTMCNAIEGQGLENTTVSVDVDVFAIQASDLGDAKTAVPAQVLEIYLNQNQ